MEDKIKTIKEIEKEYPNEFIAIHVTEYDWSTNTSKKGKDKKAVYEAELEFTKKHPGEITFFDNTLPMPESVLL